jgi:hypothetical protein
VRWSQKHQFRQSNVAPHNEVPAAVPSPSSILADGQSVILDTAQGDPPAWNPSLSQAFGSPVDESELSLWDGSLAWSIETLEKDRPSLAFHPFGMASELRYPQIGASEASDAATSAWSQDDMVIQDLVQPRQNVMASPAPQLCHLPTALTEYFFRNIISLYCTWDGKSNTMRNIIETKWQSSGVLHHTIQSMAAACLSEYFPRLLPVARSEHKEAHEIVRKGTSPAAQKQADLLAYMLLGHTSSWLDPSDLATSYFRGCHTLLQSIPDADDDDGGVSFFTGTMDYWAMLLVYLTDSEQLDGYKPSPSVETSSPVRVVNPHPYSGISGDVIKILIETGKLIFQHRKHMSGTKFMAEKDLEIFKTALQRARQLERLLLTYQSPNLAQFVEVEDGNTPLKHLALIDEAYRCTGLIQLYRVFPDLLNERYAPWSKEILLRPMPAVKMPTSAERQAWLTQLALYILGILERIPFESSTLSAQPFIAVAVSSELRINDPYGQELVPIGEAPQGLGTAFDVAQARKFLRSRLAGYKHTIPLSKSKVIMELVYRVWAALDSGEQDVYWLDIALEHKLGTMMG